MKHIHASCPIHHAFRGALSGLISSLMGIPIYCFLKTFQLYYLDSILPARWCFLPAVYTCLNGVVFAQHSEATLTPRVIRMLECVCVCDKWDYYSLSHKTIALRAPSTWGLSHPGWIRISTHQSKSCHRGQPRSLIWSVCTHRSRLPTVVTSERFVSVWVTGWKSRLFVLREYPLVSAKRMRHALPAWPPWILPCTTRSMVRKPPYIYSDCHQRQ